MDDFIFGTLATDDLRLEAERRRQGGITHRSQRKPRDPWPGQPVEVSLEAGPAYPCESGWVYWTTDGEDPGGSGGRPGHGFSAPLLPVGEAWSTLLWGYRRRLSGEIPPQPAGTVVRYCLSGVTPAGEEVPADQGACYGYLAADDPAPPWAQAAIIYQIFVDRFYPGDGAEWRQPAGPNGFYGGTLEGVRQKLDAIQDLGANTLWLTPIFPSPSHHGYDATDFYSIEPRLGTLEGMQRLLKESHVRGLRVLLDFVPNHWSSRHPTFQEASQDPGSAYRDWYQFNRWPDRYETFFGVKSLPKINLSNPQARRHVLEAARFWLAQGVDGFRVDHAVGPMPDFWADFRRVTRMTRPDCWTFGEVVDPPDVQLAFEGLLDGCLDFMLLEALRQALAFGRWDGERLAAFLGRHEAFFPPDFSRPSFLDNHDMNRFLWASNGDKERLKLAALCQFSLIGPPIIYYGTEVGLSQQRDVRQGTRGVPEEARLPMIWGADQDRDLLSFYQALTALRSRSDCLQRGGRETLSAGPDSLVYVRRLGEEHLVTALNLGKEPVEIQIPGRLEVVLGTSPQAAVQPISGKAFTRLHLAGLAGAILRPSGPAVV